MFVGGRRAPVSARARAWSLLEEALDRAALAQVAEALGCMEAVLEITSDYLKTRQQFGQPIGKFQALQHRMAEMFVEVQETRSILLPRHRPSGRARRPRGGRRCRRPR